MIETIDKQADVIRTLNEAELRRAAALEQALGSSRSSVRR